VYKNKFKSLEAHRLLKTEQSLKNFELED